MAQPGLKGMFKPTDPLVRLRQSMAIMRRTSAKAIEDRVKNGPRRRSSGSVMMTPPNSDTATAATSPIQGDTPNLT